MDKISEMLSGRKTYLAALSLFVLAAISVANKDWNQAWVQASQALGLLGLRHAMEKKDAKD